MTSSVSLDLAGAGANRLGFGLVLLRSLAGRVWLVCTGKAPANANTLHQIEQQDPAIMDPGLFLAPMTMTPEVLAEDHALMPGLVGAVPIALDWMPPETLLTWTKEIPGQPLHRRLRALLVQNRESDAWAWYHARNRAANRGTETESLLLSWVDKKSRSMGVRADALVAPTGYSDVQVRRNIRSRGQRVVSELNDLFSGLTQKPWVGPLVIQDPSLGAVPLPPRPAMPVISLDPQAADQQQIETLARTITDLSLSLSSPPPHGWPAWLRVGAHGVAVGKAQGRSPSPRKTWQERLRMGSTGIRSLLTEATPDAKSATALVAPLLHSKRRHRFGALLDLLRAGSPSEQAIIIAYDVTIEDLVKNR